MENSSNSYKNIVRENKKIYEKKLIVIKSNKEKTKRIIDDS